MTPTVDACYRLKHVQIELSSLNENDRVRELKVEDGAWEAINRSSYISGTDARSLPERRSDASEEASSSFGD